jgi:hypothetical protein
VRPKPEAELCAVTTLFEREPLSNQPDLASHSLLGAADEPERRIELLTYALRVRCSAV